MRLFALPFVLVACSAPPAPECRCLCEEPAAPTQAACPAAPPAPETTVVIRVVGDDQAEIRVGTRVLGRGVATYEGVAGKTVQLEVVQTPIEKPEPPKRPRRDNRFGSF